MIFLKRLVLKNPEKITFSTKLMKHKIKDYKINMKDINVNACNNLQKRIYLTFKFSSMDLRKASI